MPATYQIVSRDPQLRSIVISVDTEKGAHQVDVRIPLDMSDRDAILQLLQTTANETAFNLANPPAEVVEAVQSLFDDL